jgi:hypothetical protein
MTDSPAKISKRFETPILDSLKPQHRELVKHYVMLLDKYEAAKAAGYKDNNNTLHKKVDELFHNPKIVAAIDELLDTKLEQLDAGRAAVCTRLMNQSLASISDVAKRVQHENGFGKKTESRWMWQPKDLDEIEPRFHCAVSFLTENRDGTFGWDNMSQHRATVQLSKLMMWDQSILDQNPALVFNFGNIQQDEYEPPSKGVDMSAVEDTDDEVTQLTH